MASKLTSEVELHRLEASGPFPNNPLLPVVLYRAAVQGDAGDALAREIESRFDAHDWCAGWRDGVYDYAHYHSTAHEALGCFAGNARVELGGGALTVDLNVGDVLVLPAGVAHKSVHASLDFAVVGAYAAGRKYDMRKEDANRREVELSIAQVPLPTHDPVFGIEGPLLDAWRG